MFLGGDLAAQMAVGMVRFLGDESRQEDVLSQLNRVQFESDSSCEVGWAARVPI